MSATIQTNTVSFIVQATLPLLLRMVDPEELAQIRLYVTYIAELLSGLHGCYTTY